MTPQGRTFLLLRIVKQARDGDFLDYVQPMDILKQQDTPICDHTHFIVFSDITQECKVCVVIFPSE